MLYINWARWLDSVRIDLLSSTMGVMKRDFPYSEKPQIKNSETLEFVNGGFGSRAP